MLTKGGKEEELRKAIDVCSTRGFERAMAWYEAGASGLRKGDEGPLDAAAAAAYLKKRTS